MLTEEELRKFEKVVGFNLWQIERDYLQHIVMMFLSREDEKGALVFKGGTALQKAYGLNRFSLDLDFTAIEELLEGMHEAIAKDISLFGFPAEGSLEKKYESASIKLRIKGPLYKGSERSICVIRLEISLREGIILPPDVREIVPVYYDLQPYLIKVMRPEEILAEKIRAILTRTRARDVYDLWFLLRRGVKMDTRIIKEKLRLVGLDFGKEDLLERIRGSERIWKHELSPLISSVPEFETVMDDIRTLTKAFNDNKGSN